MIALKGNKSSATKNCTFKTTGLAWTNNTMFPREVVEAPLNPDRIRSGFSKANGGNPICLNADICNKSVELLESIKLCLTSKSLILNVRMGTSWCGCNTRLRSTERKVITPSIGLMPPSANPGWMKLIRSRAEATQSNICFFSFRVIFFINGSPPSMNVVDYGSRSHWSCGGSGGWISGYIPTFFLWADILFQMSCSY